MTMRARIVVVLTVLACPIATSASSTTSEKNLEQWYDQELIPFVRQQLLEHPRFKGETVTFVVLRGNAPAPVSNALALSLRDRLLNAAVDTAGINIGWQQGQTSRNGKSASISCANDNVHYFVGLQLSRQLDSSHTISVRAMDREDMNWVTGFGKTWRGNLNRSQLRALEQSRVDESFLGTRDVPFAASQADLLAQHLAHELSCRLLQQSKGIYVVAPADEPSTGVGSDPSSPTNAHDDFGIAIELIGNNIASHSAIELTSDGATANATLSGKAHKIDGGLYQYWLTISPKANDDELTTLNASAYVLAPDTRLAGHPSSDSHPIEAVATELTQLQLPKERGSISIPNAGREALIGPLHVSAPSTSDACDSRNKNLVVSTTNWSRDRHCSLLSADTYADAVVFVIEHQPRLGLVRIGAGQCRERTPALVSRAGTRVTLPIAYSRVGNRQSDEITNWFITPGRDTYYAIAVNNEKIARHLANHIDDLPMRCGASLRPGLTGTKLRRWLNEFAMIAARSSKHIDWRAIELSDEI